MIFRRITIKHFSRKLDTVFLVFKLDTGVSYSPDSHTGSSCARKSKGFRKKRTWSFLNVRRLHKKETTFTECINLQNLARQKQNKNPQWVIQVKSAIPLHRSVWQCSCPGSQHYLCFGLGELGKLQDLHQANVIPGTTATVTASLWQYLAIHLWILLCCILSSEL